jgi:uncharacterized protein YcnI
MKIRRIHYALVGAACAAVAAPVVAQAHVTVEPTTAAADNYANLEFTVPHGCDGSPTTSLRVKVPRTVPSVTPGRHPLWTLETKQGRKQKTELHGETITRGISEVTWTATQPLEDKQLDVLRMSVRLPATAGETVWFPVIQECAEGQTRWIQIPAEGQSPDDLDEPAPGVELTAAEGGHGETEDAASADPAEEESQETESASATGGGGGDGDDGAPTWLVVVALVLGALGLVAGLAAGRRARTA